MPNNSYGASQKASWKRSEWGLCDNTVVSQNWSYLPRTGIILNISSSTYLENLVKMY